MKLDFWSFLRPPRIVKDTLSNQSRKEVESQILLNIEKILFTNCTKSAILFPSQSPKYAPDMTCTIYVGIFRQVLAMSEFFQTSFGYVGIFSDTHQICRHIFRISTSNVGIYSDNHQICRNFFRKTVDTLVFFHTRNRYVGIFSEKFQIRGIFSDKHQIYHHFLRQALDMQTFFQSITRYVDIL